MQMRNRADEIDRMMRAEIAARVDERRQQTAAWQESMLVPRRSNNYKQFPEGSSLHLTRLRDLVKDWSLSTPFDWVSCAFAPTVAHHLFGNLLMRLDLVAAITTTLSLIKPLDGSSKGRRFGGSTVTRVRVTSLQ